MSNSKVLRFSGEKEEEYESWRFWAKAHLMTKRKKDELGVIENEEELAAELVTLLEPNSVAWQAIHYLK